MKEINEYTSEILDKVKRKKKQKRNKKIVIISITCLTLVFLTLYSNILPLNKFDFEKYAYEKYRGIYLNEGENTIFSFTNNSNAVLCVNSVPYSLTTKSNTKNEFNFDASKMQKETVETEDTLNYLDNTAIKIEFYDGEAIIYGNIYGFDISINLKFIANTQMESGIWIKFDKDNVNSTNFNSYIVVNDNGDTYYIDGIETCFEILFISVYKSEFTVLIDNYGAPSDFIEITKIDKSVYGENVIKLNSYTDGREQFFKLMNNSDILDYNGEEFNANFVKAQKDVEYFGKNDNAKYLPIKWRLTQEESFSQKLIDCTAKLNLNSDKSVNLEICNEGKTTSYSGKWFATDKNIIVILDKYSLFGKTFVVHHDNDNKQFSKNAKTEITIHDMYKVGYHDFIYYFTTTKYNVYWGKDFDYDKVNNVIKYDEEYLLNGYYYKYFYDKSLPFNYDTENLAENGKVKIVLHENGTLDVTFENRTQKIRYTLKSYDGNNNYNIKLKDGIYLVREQFEDKTKNTYIIIKEFNFNDGCLTAVQTISYLPYGKIIQNHYISFELE